MASILISMVTMIVVSLIVMGFAQISRRDQGNTVDKQLSTQAFYAAESGVNDARQVINTAVTNSQPIPAKTSCNTNTDGAGYNPNYPVPSPGNNGVMLDNANNVSYTCLLVDPTPSALVEDGVGDNSWVVPLNTSSAIDTIKIQWTPSPAISAGNPTTDCTGSLDKFNPASGSASNYNCGYGVLRMDLVPSTGAMTGGASGSLISSQLTGFFQPLSSSGSGTLAYAAGNIGKANVVAAQCDESSYTTCTATITGLSGTGYMLKINSLYKTSNVTVTALSGGTPMPTNGQILVDATGNANGVLRRLQVRLSTDKTGGIIPRYAIQSNSAICKRFLVTPTYYSNSGDVINPQLSTSDPHYNPMCDNTKPAAGTPDGSGSCALNTTLVNEDWITSAPSGTLQGNAKWLSGQYVELDNGGPGIDGEVNYTVTGMGSCFDAKFSFWAVSGGGNGTYMYAYDTSIPDSWGLPHGGYSFAYDDDNSKAEIYFDGAQIASASISAPNNSAWHSAEVVKTNNQFTMYMDGSQVLNFTDIARSLTGNNFGVGGCSCTVAGDHRATNFLFKSDAGTRP